mgnify:CR=1 FL=1
MPRMSIPGLRITETDRKKHGSMKPTRRKSKFAVQEDSDPLSVVVNLFDVAMVFAVALMVAMVMHMNMTEVFTQEDFTVVKNPGKENMEIIMKEGNKINKYTPLRTAGFRCEGQARRHRLRTGKRRNHLCTRIINRTENEKDPRIVDLLPDRNARLGTGEKCLHAVRRQAIGSITRR